MKNLLFIITLLFLTSCIGYRYSSEFKETYSEYQIESVLQDVHNIWFLFDIDSIPLENWILTQSETKKGFSIERSYILKDASNHEFLFIYTTFIEKDTIYYEFEILERGKYNFKP